MQDLDAIDMQVGQKRLRTKKHQKGLPIIITTKKVAPTSVVTTPVTNDNSASFRETEEEENKRRKNKQQVKILQNEYAKSTKWTRPFMRELSKRTGLKASQVYKWHWDQKKKEIEESKIKNLSYPSEIF